MPISSIDGCSEAHWSEVKNILTSAIKKTQFEGELVSQADDSGIIQKTIIQNLYDNQIVVCDVSCKNPNVMFELGIRLAFDKPTIIIKDDQTSYSFDTSPIEHLDYPRDLRYSKIVEFKKRLAEKIEATYKKSKNDPNYTTFLKHFGTFKVAKLDEKEVSGNEYMLEELQTIKYKLNTMASQQRTKKREDLFIYQNNSEVITLIGKHFNRIDLEEINNLPCTKAYNLQCLDDQELLKIKLANGWAKQEALELIRSLDISEFNIIFYPQDDN